MIKPVTGGLATLGRQNSSLNHLILAIGQDDAQARPWIIPGPLAARAAPEIIVTRARSRRDQSVRRPSPAWFSASAERRDRWHRLIPKATIGVDWHEVGNNYNKPEKRQIQSFNKGGVDLPAMCSQ